MLQPRARITARNVPLNATFLVVWRTSSSTRNFQLVITQSGLLPAFRYIPNLISRDFHIGNGANWCSAGREKKPIKILAAVLSFGFRFEVSKSRVLIYRNVKKESDFLYAIRRRFMVIGSGLLVRKRRMKHYAVFTVSVVRDAKYGNCVWLIWFSSRFVHPYTALFDAKQTTMMQQRHDIRDAWHAIHELQIHLADGSTVDNSTHTHTHTQSAHKFQVPVSRSLLEFHIGWQRRVVTTPIPSSASHRTHFVTSFVVVISILFSHRCTLHHSASHYLHHWNKIPAAGIWNNPNGIVS